MSIIIMNKLDKLEGKLDRVKRYENYLLSLCPFHDDHNPSFLVYEEYYVCKACGKKGKTTALLDKLDYSYVQPSRSFYTNNPWTGWLRSYSLEEVTKKAYNVLQKLPHQGIYLHRRGIDHELITNLKIGYLDGWYTIPVFDKQNNLIGSVARIGDTESDVRYMTPPDQEMLLYCPNWRRLEASRSVFIVYGMIDSVSLEKLGLASLTGTLGKNLDAELLRDIRKRMYIIPDNGEEKEANILASELGWRGHTTVPDYPYDAKDVNDLLVKYPEKIQEIINEMDGRLRSSSRISY